MGYFIAAMFGFVVGAGVASVGFIFLGRVAMKMSKNAKAEQAFQTAGERLEAMGLDEDQLVTAADQAQEILDELRKQRDEIIERARLAGAKIDTDEEGHVVKH